MLIIGAILIAGQAYGDWQLNSAEDLSDSEAEEVLVALNSQGGEELSVEDYQDFHDAARDSGGYLLRASGLGLAAVLILIGAPLLFKLNPLGAKLSIAGASIGFLGGVAGSYQLNQAAMETLHGPLSFTYEMLMYLCGVCMAVCVALAVMPLFNVAARMALYGEDKVSPSPRGRMRIQSSFGRGHFFASTFSKSSFNLAFHQSEPCQIAYLPRIPLRSAPLILQLRKLDKFKRALRRSAFLKSAPSKADFAPPARRQD